MQARSIFVVWGVGGDSASKVRTCTCGYVYPRRRFRWHGPGRRDGDRDGEWMAYTWKWKCF